MRHITAVAVAYDVERELSVPRCGPPACAAPMLRTGAGRAFVKSTRFPRTAYLDAAYLDAAYLDPGGPYDAGNMALSTPLGDTIVR
jgi:hypothetical protein